MRCVFVVVLTTVSLALLALPALAERLTTVDFEADDGTIYRLTTGTSSGSCAPIERGMKCLDGGHEASATNDSGCGSRYGLGSCIVISKTIPPPSIPMATSTLECEDKNYEVSDGGTGTCSPNDGVSMQCTQEGTSNFASASCENGCGQVSGTGSCEVKTKPK